QTWMDDSTSAFDLMTQSVAKAICATGALGLPDDAAFAGNAEHPPLQLHWNNNDDGPNSRVADGGGVISFDVPPDYYSQIQAFGLSGAGDSTLQILIAYNDGTSTTSAQKVLDWFTDPAGPGQFFIINDIDRASKNVCQLTKDPSITGLNLNPDPTKKAT